ncbi:diguanylate cyclase [Idiomarina sp.]|uniref:sensor domain-containing diguanylate cyclase n=1 Tax=Idiomarina sp. TaxID=1874361 RepID=UPI003515A392
MPESNSVSYQQAMENCAREPVHAPQCVQSIGCLLAIDIKGEHIVAVSENSEAILRRSVNELMEKRLDECMSDDFISQFSDARQRLKNGSEHEILAWSDGQQDFFSRVYFSQSWLVIETEPDSATSDLKRSCYFDRALLDISNAKNVEQTMQKLCQAIAELSGYERVLVYKFDDDWNGRVVCEHTACEAIEQYIGLSFPASDSPSHVRELYRVNPIRYIADVDTEDAMIRYADSLSPTRLDLSLGTLRGKSPIHTEYMKNMGLQRSMSVALFDQNQLWGLVSCHGVSAQQLSYSTRLNIHSLVKLAEQRLMLHKQFEADRFFDRVEESRKALLDRKREIKSPQHLLEDEGDYWLTLFEASAVALITTQTHRVVGDDIDVSTLQKVRVWLNENHGVTGLFTERDCRLSELRQAVPELPYCGVLAVSMPVDKRNQGWLVFFRQQETEVFRWAGSLEKGDVREYQGRQVLSPRNSFKQWQQNVDGYAPVWTSVQVEAAKTLAEDLAIGASAFQIEKLNQELTEANERLEHLVHTDALTQVWNRYHMEQTLEEEVKRCERHGRNLSVILLDIDHFKRVNDDYGHDVGDNVLKLISEALDKWLRSSDVFGRWGGEEFLIIAPETDLESAGQLAERLRRRLANLQFDKVGQVTASFGVAELSRSESRNSLVKRADNALYQVKESGRNSVEVSPGK